MEVKIEDWIQQHNLNVEYHEDNILKIKDEDKFFFILSYKETLFSEDLFLNLSRTEYEIADGVSADDRASFFFLFQFGKDWYYCPYKTAKAEDGELKYVIALIDFKYVGKTSVPSKTNYYLGIHTEYELLNSALNYKTAIKKAKFLGMKSLGICDENTLGGALGFQIECTKNGIKPIIGETINIGTKSNVEGVDIITRKVKLYCTTEEGWFNLLNINNKMNTEFGGNYITEDFLLSHGKGLICVFSFHSSPLAGWTDKKLYEKYINVYKRNFDAIYYQFSSVQYSNESIDAENLTSFKFYLDNFMSDDFPFAIIDDTFYLEDYEQNCKITVNKISKNTYPNTTNQWFKSSEDVENEIKPFFEESKRNLKDFMELGYKGTEAIATAALFEIPMDGSKLPRFEIEGQQVDFEESKELLRMLCEEGFEQKVVEVFDDKKLIKRYRERLETEFSVITNAGFAHYFLILWDTVAFANENDYMIGTGRGSVGGSLLAYLTGITRIDPIKYDLLFERFLNEARIAPQKFFIFELENGEEIEFLEGTMVNESIGKKAEDLVEGDEITIPKKKITSKIKSSSSVLRMRGDQLPDVDIDFTTASRDIIKDHLKTKYGKNYTCSVGTYGRLKLRQTFKDLAKIEGVNFQDTNELTKKIDDQQEYEFLDLFKYAKKDNLLYRFIQSHPDMINKLKVVLNNPKSVSIHPSAVLVLPKQDHLDRERSLSDWIPIRSIDGNNISEWEGKYCDIFGLLKNDILGLAQLDKFTYCLDLIKKNTGEVIDLDNIEYDDEYTFRLFQNGFNEDVFQFGSTGLKSYSKEVKPDCIDDLIAMAALYRPGPMSSNAHTDFGKIKHGEKEPDYDWGMEEITKATNGLWVYQEQIMQAFVRSGFTLVEADSVRTIMKKFDKKKMAEVRDKFTDGLAKQIGKGGHEIASKIFDKLVGFSAYGFNKSHSAAYGLIAYQSQWLKANYPLEFWTTTLNFCNEDDMSYVLKELESIKRKFSKYKQVSVVSADINFSSGSFGCNTEDESVTWSLVKIKGVGEKAVEGIIEVRDKVQRFNSLDHFLEVVPKKSSNKTVVTRLILAGAFDAIENIETALDRAMLLLQFYDERKIDAEECKYLNDPDVDKEWKWRTWEKELTGHGMIDYLSILKISADPEIIKNYMEADEFVGSKFKELKDFKFNNLPIKVLCGHLRDFQERTSKSGKVEFLKFWLDCNSREVPVTVWGRKGINWESIKEKLGKMVYIRGAAAEGWKGENMIYMHEDCKKKPLIGLI